MWFNLEKNSIRGTDLWREGKHPTPGDEHSSDPGRGRMEHSWSIPYSIGSKRTTAFKSATKIGLWWGLAAKQGNNEEEEEEVPQVCLPVPAQVGQAGAAGHSLAFGLLSHRVELSLDVMLNWM